MKALSLWQPWASLWLTDHKIHETRGWHTNYRGWLIVHAAKRLESHCGEQLDEICINAFGPPWRLTLPRGAILGAVKLEGCAPTDRLTWPEGEPPDDFWCGNFAPERFAWRRSMFIRLDEPFPYRGRQGLFDIPREALGGRCLVPAPEGGTE